jgi:hypothetical protein
VPTSLAHFVRSATVEIIAPAVYAWLGLHEVESTLSLSGYSDV